MTQIDNLTAQANQTTQVVLDDGSVLSITLTYYPTTQRWFMDLSHTTLTVEGIGLCMHPNLLREWRNVIPFGIACTNTSGQDPVNVDDFSTGRAAIYVLNSADVDGVEANVLGGALQ